MIRLNFIPEAQRRGKPELSGEDLGGVPAEIIVGNLLLLAGVLLLVHVILAGVGAVRLAQYKLLEGQWESMTTSRNAYNELTNEVKRLQTRMNSVKPVTSLQKLHWPRFLNDISDSVPPSLWLREITFENGALTISGSAVSSMKNEMVDAGNFVSALKEKAIMRENFTPLEVDSIKGRTDTAASIADFTLKAKRK